MTRTASVASVLLMSLLVVGAANLFGQSHKTNPTTGKNTLKEGPPFRQYRWGSDLAAIQTADPLLSDCKSKEKSPADMKGYRSVRCRTRLADKFDVWVKLEMKQKGERDELQSLELSSAQIFSRQIPSWKGSDEADVEALKKQLRTDFGEPTSGSTERPSWEWEGLGLVMLTSFHDNFHLTYCSATYVNDLSHDL